MADAGRIAVPASRGWAHILRGLAVILLVAPSFLGGCAPSEGEAPAALAPAVAATNRSCQALRTEITKMEARGTTKLIDRQHDGGKVSSREQAEIDTYNSLLNEYLGARCHLN